MTRSMIKNLNYDRKYDVLSLRFSNTKNSYGDEEIKNIVELRDTDTDVLTGVTIMGFRKMYDEQDGRIQSIMSIYNLGDIYKVLFGKK